MREGHQEVQAVLCNLLGIERAGVQGTVGTESTAQYHLCALWHRVHGWWLRYKPIWIGQSRLWVLPEVLEARQAALH